MINNSKCYKKFQAAHYIGEMCRYILATPMKPTDKQHKVRTVYGNGMRPTVSINANLIDPIEMNIDKKED